MTHDLAHVSCLGIESSKLSECVEQIKSKKIRGVFGFPGFGFREDDLDFLKEMPWIEAIWFWDVNLSNIDGLYSLHDLTSFGVHPKRPSVNFARIPLLKKLVIEPRPKDSGLINLRGLESLHLWHYRPKTRDFKTFEFPESIAELEINWANAEDLDSIPPLKNLKRLEIHRCRNLHRLTALGKKFPNLQHFVVEACGRIKVGEGAELIKECPGIKHARVQGVKLV